MNSRAKVPEYISGSTSTQKELNRADYDDWIYILSTSVLSPWYELILIKLLGSTFSWQNNRASMYTHFFFLNINYEFHKYTCESSGAVGMGSASEREAPGSIPEPE